MPPADRRSAGKVLDRWGTAARVVSCEADRPDSSLLVELEPGDAKETAAMLEWAAAERVPLMPVGSGTKVSWGGAAGVHDIRLSTRHLNTPVQHFADDLVATMPAGATLADVNALLGRERQWLPLDPMYADRATIGGTIAANDSGPRRQKHGTSRDLILGIEIATTGGLVAHSGGRVVKNVAGYDLARLMCGSFGSLAVITSATFKLAPVPPASRTVVASVGDVARAQALALAIAAGPLAPSAVEVAAPPARLLVRFETTERASQEQAAAVRAAIAAEGLTAEIVSGADETESWSRHTRHLAPPGTLLKVAVLPTRAGAALGGVEHAAASAGVECRVTGRVALGVLMVRLSENADQHCRLVPVIRQVIETLGGTVAVLESPFGAEVADPWGRPGDSLQLMRAVKARFDPQGILASGCGPGAWL
jgi:glycolate oxidase FAD binding subunit